MTTTDTLPYVVLKGRLLHPEGRQVDMRTLRLIGRYPTFGRAVDAALAACMACRSDEDARLFRYRVTTEANIPAGVVFRSTPHKARTRRTD